MKFHLFLPFPVIYCGLSVEMLHRRVEIGKQDFRKEELRKGII
jgi:hypothetical protein